MTTSSYLIYSLLIVVFSGDAPDSYLGAARFESQPEHWLQWQSFVSEFLSLSGHMSRND
jgi:hypothetical protein